MDLNLGGLNPIAAISNVITTVIDRVVPDKAAADAAKLEMFKIQQSNEFQQMVAQLEINKVEAANPKLFVSGWRPFIGWVCGLGCAWNWIGLPVGVFVANTLGHPLDLHPADLSEMMPLLLGMLGLGGLRTFEKVAGVAAK